MYIVLEFQTLRKIIAPRHSKPYLLKIIQERKLDVKYGDEAYHLDRAFELLYCPVCKKFEPAIDGSALKGVLNYIIRASGKNPKQILPKVITHGIFASEEDITYTVKSYIEYAYQLRNEVEVEVRPYES